MNAKRANLTVRLFCALLLVPASRAFPEETIPPSWREEAKEERGDSTESGLIADFERELVRRIRERILETSREEAFQPYQSTSLHGEFTLPMVAISGGSFVMGSPASEAHRQPNEGPVREVTVSDFWIGETEVTWGQFLPFAMRDARETRNKNGTPKFPEETDELIDWVSAPSQVYASPDMGLGLDERYPAIGMTQHAANKFCQWLSLQTGHYYRLPTEAEWEYACRAGTTTPYSCPTGQIEEYAVVDPEFVRDRYGKVGTKRPNPWGLFDMHGNVAEWCLDGYDPDAYRKLPSRDPLLPATQRYPRVIRGGSWWDDAIPARSAHRAFSHPDLNVQDPQLPQSVWWLVDSQWIGFRIVRPREVPDEETMFHAWNTGAMHHDKEDWIPSRETEK